MTTSGDIGLGRTCGAPAAYGSVWDRRLAAPPTPALPSVTPVGPSSGFARIAAPTGENFPYWIKTEAAHRVIDTEIGRRAVVGRGLSGQILSVELGLYSP